ncbi:MAG: hypothetical protein HFG72_05215 [Hungatella sp.]|nr:hypothetical protein [Hungatella sp.]
MASVGRSLKIMFVSMVLSLLCSMAVYAGQWRLDHVGWWYENDDGTYASNGWYWVDSLCYYFNQQGYCLLDTITPDGYTVNANGAWHINGTVQYKGDKTCDNFEDAILDYYSDKYPDDGSYVIFDSEIREDNSSYYFIVRYQMTEAEAEARIKQGGMPAANIYHCEVSADKYSGIVKNEYGDILLHMQ